MTNEKKLIICFVLSIFVVMLFAFKESKKTILVKDVEVFNGCKGFKLIESCGRKYFYIRGVSKKIKIKSMKIVNVEGEYVNNFNVIKSEHMSGEKLRSSVRSGQTRVIFTGMDFYKNKIEYITIEITYYNIFQQMAERLLME